VFSLVLIYKSKQTTFINCFDISVLLYILCSLLCAVISALMLLLLLLLLAIMVIMKLVKVRYCR